MPPRRPNSDIIISAIVIIIVISTYTDTAFGFTTLMLKVGIHNLLVDLELFELRLYLVQLGGDVVRGLNGDQAEV